MRQGAGIGWRRVVFFPLVLLLSSLFPLMAYSGGEVVLEQYVSKLVVYVGEEVTFGTSPLPASLAGVTVRWDFGDDTQATGWPVVHVYEEAGEYDVRAQITYPDGTEVPTIPTRIRVMATENEPPVAQATISPQETMAGLPITFDASGSYDPDGEISRYRWRFGDGNEAMTATVRYTYAQAGTYHIVLEVTDNGQMDASEVFTVTIRPLPTSLLPGIDRSVPPAPGAPPILAPLNLLDMGVYDPGRQPFQEFSFPIDPPYQGVAGSNRTWLIPEPTEFAKDSGPRVVLRLRVKVRDTGLLPRAHTSWGLVTMIVNGRLVELPAAVTIRGPEEDISAEVWALFDKVLEKLTDMNRRSAMVYVSGRYPNGADLALGLITEYVIEDGYAGQIPEDVFVAKVVELLTGEDQNGDGTVGFTGADRELGVKVEP